VKLHQERWHFVNDKVGKVNKLVDNVVATCRSENLEEDDLPHSLPIIFRSLELYALHS
jgi:hypothetical protein